VQNFKENITLKFTINQNTTEVQIKNEHILLFLILSTYLFERKVLYTYLRKKLTRWQWNYNLYYIDKKINKYRMTWVPPPCIYLIDHVHLRVDYAATCGRT